MTLLPSILAQAAPAPEIFGPVDMTGSSLLENPWVLAGISLGIALLGGLVVFIFLRMRQVRSHENLPAELRGRLAALRSSPPNDPVVLLSATATLLRRGIHYRYGILAETQTAAELQRKLAGHPDFAAADSTLALLADCERARFGGGGLNAGELMERAEASLDSLLHGGSSQARGESKRKGGAER